LLRSKESEENRLRSKIDSLDTKCSRLREYIKKLTAKCEEWELSYEQQANSMEKLQSKNLRIRERASEIANRYRKLAGVVERRNQVRVK
jgi:chromosome segregation ATPase